MEFTELIKKRYSVRGYTADPVEAEKLKQVLEAARIAPTAANRQPFHIIVLHTKGRQEELRRMYDKEWFVEAPLIVVVCIEQSKAWTRHDRANYGVVDAAIVMDHLILEATNQGLGTCWIGAFDAEAAREILGLPEDIDPIVMTPLGYSNAESRGTDRKSLVELVRYERW